jgi:hypothetical protein
VKRPGSPGGDARLCGWRAERDVACYFDLFLSILGTIALLFGRLRERNVNRAGSRTELRILHRQKRRTHIRPSEKGELDANRSRRCGGESRVRMREVSLCKFAQEGGRVTAMGDCSSVNYP